ncbi:hypothetical protein [Streptomyces sp. NPDC003247]
MTPAPRPRSRNMTPPPPAPGTEQRVRAHHARASKALNVQTEPGGDF